MFFTKKTQVLKDTPQDRKRKQLQNDLHHKEKHLHNVVWTVLSRKIAAEVYPDGADKESARKELEYARKVVLNCVADYDLSKKELVDYINSNIFETTKDWPTVVMIRKSHDIVERACEDFYGVWR